MARTRFGCLNCKSKRRKCDEAKPVCGRCSNKGEKCEWSSRLVFRAENALGISSAQVSPSRRRPTRYRIKDITAEVIRDYNHHDPMDEPSPSESQLDVACPSPTANEQDLSFQISPMWQREAALEGSPASAAPFQPPNVGIHRAETDTTGISTLELSNPGELDRVWHSPATTGFIDESIFLPGSAYFDAHSTLRSHLIHELRSNAPTRQESPEFRHDAIVWPTESDFFKTANRTARSSVALDDLQPKSLNFSQPSAAQLSDDEEFVLWKNWVDEIAPWLDKFDSERHFQHTLPVMARSHGHLRFSILAVSARQLERKQRSRHTERSLALYQMAIHHVLPELHTRSTAVIASCVVLAVLEMLSSSPMAWRQHLDGCAHLIQAVGINGFSGGIDEALFWCFARMDVCGGFIASMKTLVRVDHWASGVDLDADIDLFRARKGFNAYACQAVYLCAQVLDLLACRPNLAERVGASPPTMEQGSDAYAVHWTRLWRYIDCWYRERPAEMLPVSSVSMDKKPFPRVLYTNPAAVSGNQLYHTASILMLRHKPSKVTVTPKPNSIFWHARQICAISISNHHHGAWTNSVQPIWIAGQWMSHRSEQEEILKLLETIENETGWGTKWRAEDLKDFWGYDCV